MSGLYGLPGILDRDIPKVRQANRCVRWMIKLIRFALAHNCRVAIENPEQSLIWNVPSLQKLMLDAQVVVTSHCSHQGCFQKRTKLVSWNVDLSSLSTKCKRGARECFYSGQPHIPLGSSSEVLQAPDKKSFITSAASQYPWPLCRKVARVIAKSEEDGKPSRRPVRRCLERHFRAPGGLQA